MTRAERVEVDWTRCEGRGLCHELLPELFVADDWGYPLSRSGGPAPALPARLREHGRRAVSECPRLALRIAPVEPERRRGRTVHGRIADDQRGS